MEYQIGLDFLIPFLEKHKLELIPLEKGIMKMKNRNGKFVIFKIKLNATSFVQGDKTIKNLGGGLVWSVDKSSDFLLASQLEEYIVGIFSNK
jgi:hypothetical protein